MRYTSKKKFRLSLVVCLFPSLAFGTTYNFYVGNLHSHTSYSDGVGTPAVAFTYARDTARIDFLAVTDHNTQLSQAKFDDTRLQATLFTQDGVFVAIAGQEWTTNAGHSCVFEADRIFTSTTIPDFYSELVTSGCSATFNHPTYPSTAVFNNLAYSDTADWGMNAMEVRWDGSPPYSGPAYDEEARYIFALNNGWHIGADGSQDNHDATWGDATSRFGPGCWTVAVATALTKPDILAAHREHRTYSTHDRNLQLLYRINNVLMGETLTNPQYLNFEITVHDLDTNDNFQQLQLIQNGSVITTINLNTTSYTWQFMVPVPTAIKEHYYFVKIKQADGNMAWSSPIWVKVEPVGINHTFWQKLE
ncbi:MAG: CehA/McbA family metallohydrolase [bacterium]|nr:CehA/McbA family metallohydrolase [bacterium]